MNTKRWYFAGKENLLGKRIAQRVEELESSLAKESWLPISLRGLLAVELPQILKTVRSGGSAWKKRVSKQLLVVSMASWIYGPSPLLSKTVAGIQALELEVNGSQSHERELSDAEGES